MHSPDMHDVHVRRLAHHSCISGHRLPQGDLDDSTGLRVDGTYVQ